MSTATGSFELHDWADDIYDDAPGAQLGRSTARKTFTGGLTGESTLTMMSVATPQPDGAFQGTAYVALERFTGTLDGHPGSFVLLHVADRTTGMRVTIVPGSADNALTTLTGTLHITRTESGTHTYTLEYELP
jgi:hypothetical protein